MITIFTDGSSKGNPGPGGWAAIIGDREQVREVGGGEKFTTNNRMELTAAIRALEHLEPTEDSITIYTDSEYLLKGITKWVHNWVVKNWKTAARKQVENQDLWQVLLKNVEGKEIEWKYVAGHAGTPANERCDEIAQSFADGTAVDLYDAPRANYRVSLNP